MIEHPFEPILFRDTRVLILGSFPSIKSIENSFYYSHPQNQFWRIVSMVTGYPALIKDQRIWLLKESKWGLWDMIKETSRETSADSSLYDEEPNDIPSLLEKHPSIEKIAFTGRKAQQIFEFHFGYLSIPRVYLPSPSSAYAKMSIEKKATIYKESLIV
jgi:hypoxanthine-DNA glycosylase